MSQIILASSSPFRRELLLRLQLEFSCSSPDIDESMLDGETPAELVQRLATEKARVIAKTSPHAIVIGSDQVATFDNKILGKPGNFDGAVKQLTMLSSKEVTFHTGLSVIYRSHIQTENIIFTVVFKTLSNNKIRRYLKKEPAFNCAGSFKSEGLGISLIDKMAGDDPTSLIGLPLICLTRMFEKIGVDVP